MGGYAVAPDEDDFDDLLRLTAELGGEAEIERFLRGLASPVARRLYDGWSWQAHGGQRAPDGEWPVWMLMAGRGFGKTMAGARWVAERAREDPRARIALVGANEDDVAKVMIEGESGLLATARTGEGPCWLRSKRTLFFPSGARAFVYSGEAPEKLRGPEHHFAWCDELAKWAYADSAWDNLMLGLRLGERPRALVTTTPRARPIVRRILALAGTRRTKGRTEENVHSAEAFRAGAKATYGGTRLGRQELDGELIEDSAGSLWPREMIERSRHSGALPREELKRVVVGVDPPASAEGDAGGIVVCALGQDDRLYVLADASVAGCSPEGWARKVVAVAHEWGADRVVAEANNGGEMVAAVLRGVEPGLPVKCVHASRGKAARAEPVAVRFETGKAWFAGRFPELEDELAGLSWGGDYQGPTRSPDRADAMVWAMTELMEPARAEPRVRRL